jgi:orotidine-5'-phosphate decarboxylase
LGSLVESLTTQSTLKQSKIVLALDTIKGSSGFGLEEAIRLLEKVSNSTVGVKLGLPAYINLGSNTKSLIKRFPELCFVADWKTADVPHVTKLILENLFCNLGFNAAIMHAFVGLDSLETAKKVADDNNAEIISVVAMSNPGSVLLNRVTDELLQLSIRAGIRCFVAPSTQPELILRVKAAMPASTIFSPGVGVQGGSASKTIKRGADYLIVGRAITDSADPVKSAKTVAELSWN